MLPFILRGLGFDPAASSAPVCSHAGGGDGVVHLFFRGAVNFARDAFVVQQHGARAKLDPVCAVRRGPIEFWLLSFRVQE